MKTFLATPQIILNDKKLLFYSELFGLNYWEFVVMANRS